MNSIKISIIVPIYNVEKYLSRCIDSLLNQTLEDIEIILVDDGSPDNCPAICNEYALKDNRIKVIHKKNEGLGYARNSGIDIATGEYIAFVDSDDYVALDMYEKLYIKLKDDDYDMVSSGFYNITTTTRKAEFIYDKVFHKQYILDFLSDIIASDINENSERKYSMSVWHSIYRKEIIDRLKIRFLSERDILSEDILFDLTYIPKCQKIALIPDALYFHCVEDDANSLTKCFKESKIDALFHLLQKMNLLADINDLSILKMRIMRFFIGYSRGMIKSIISSKMQFQDKKRLCDKIYSYKGWEDIWIQYPISTLPIYPRLIIYGIRYHLFYLHLCIFRFVILLKH